jgi:hypothetical protein
MKEGSSSEPVAKRQRKGKEVMNLKPTERKSTTATKQTEERKKATILLDIKTKLDQTQTVKNWLVKKLAEIEMMLNFYEQTVEGKPSTELRLATGDPPTIDTLVYTRRNKEPKHGVNEAEITSDTALTLLTMSKKTGDLNDEPIHPRNN